jgi:hypothetical protein
MLYNNEKTYNCFEEFDFVKNLMKEKNYKDDEFLGQYIRHEVLRFISKKDIEDVLKNSLELQKNKEVGKIFNII